MVAPYQKQDVVGLPTMVPSHYSFLTQVTTKSFWGHLTLYRAVNKLFVPFLYL